MKSSKKIKGVCLEVDDGPSDEQVIAKLSKAYNKAVKELAEKNKRIASLKREIQILKERKP